MLTNRPAPDEALKRPSPEEALKSPIERVDFKQGRPSADEAYKFTHPQKPSNREKVLTSKVVGKTIGQVEAELKGITGFTTGMVPAVAGGLAGIGKLISSGDIEATTKTIQDVQQKLQPFFTYTPVTEEGKKAKSTLERFADTVINKPSETIGEFFRSQGTKYLGVEAGSALGAGVYAATQLVAYSVLFKGLGGIKEKISSGKPLSPKETALFEKHLSDVADKAQQMQKALPRGPIVVGEGTPVEMPTTRITMPKEAPEVTPPISSMPKTEINASSESSASLEAIRRSKTTKFYEVDTRTGKEKPLIGVDAVDKPVSPYGIKFSRSLDGKETILDKGVKAKESYTPNIKAKAGAILNDLVSKPDKILTEEEKVILKEAGKLRDKGIKIVDVDSYIDTSTDKVLLDELGKEFGEGEKIIPKLLKDESSANKIESIIEDKVVQHQKNAEAMRVRAATKKSDIWLKEADKEEAKALENGEKIKNAAERISLEARDRVASEVERLKAGPGAMTSGAKYADFGDLTRKLKGTSPVGTSLKDRIGIGKIVTEKLTGLKDDIGKPIELFKSIFSSVHNYWKELLVIDNPEDFKRALGDVQYQRQVLSLEAKDFVKKTTAAGFNPKLGEALFNWREAGGDMSTLAEWARTAPADVKQGYIDAMNLTPKEIEYGKDFANFIYLQLNDAINQGFLEDGVQNYVRRIRINNPKLADKISGEMGYGFLKNDPNFIKKRLFGSAHEGELHGVRYKKDIRYSMIDWSESFVKAKTTRELLTKLKKGIDSKGRPLLILDGGGRFVTGGKDQVLVYPDVIGRVPKVQKPGGLPGEHLTAKDFTDYKDLGSKYPAMRDWKWATKDSDGNPVMIKGHLRVNPEIATHLENILKESAVRKYRVGRAVLKTGTTLKQTLLGPIGLFHQVQEGNHSVLHWVDPFGKFEISPEKVDMVEGKPIQVQKLLMRNGLDVAGGDARSTFEEGVSGGGLFKHVPVLGDKAVKYNDWLFNEKIPQMKMALGTKAFSRNRVRFPELSDEVIAEISAREATAAFGEINYDWIGRNPTTQDILNMVFLAPDFGESRMNFVAQALTTKLGREQTVALLRGAALFYIPFRIANYIINKDPVFDPYYAFSLKVGDRVFSPRLILDDLMRLVTNPSVFIDARLNPYTIRALQEALTGRDSIGRPRSRAEQLVDYIKNIMPIPSQGLAPSLTSATWWTSLLASMGIRSAKFYTPAERYVHEQYLKGLPQMTKEDRYRFKLLEAYHKNETPEKLDKLERESGLPPKVLNQIYREGQTPNLIRWFKALKTDKYEYGVDKAIYAWHSMTTSERQQMRQYLAQKYRDINSVPLKDQEKERQKLDKALGEPDENAYLTGAGRRWETRGENLLDKVK